MPTPRSRLWIFVPAAVAILAFANTVPGDFVYDDVVLIEQSKELRAFDLDRIFLQNYWGADHADRNYRPLVLLTYAINFLIGEGAWSFHVVNILLNAGVATLVFLVLRELLGDPPLAALGAALFAVLPIHTEAVANIVGRAELLAALAVFGAWWIALRWGEPWRIAPAVAISAVLFCGLLAKESTLAAVPLIALGSFLLWRRVPWLAVAGSLIASIGYVALRGAVLAGKTDVQSLVDNPLHAAGDLTRVLNALKLVGLYAVKIVAPVHLSADYSFDQIQVAPAGDPILWIVAAAVLLALLLPLAFCRRRAPLVALAALHFAVTFSLTANILFPIGTIFAERLAYTPSFAYALLLCVALKAPWSGSRRGAAAGLLCALILLYGARTFVRNKDWSDRATLYLRMPIDAPSSAQSYLKAADGYLELWRRAKMPKEGSDLLDKAEVEARRSMAIYSESGKAEAKVAELLFHKERYAEAAECFSRAIPALIQHRQIQPAALRLWGSCYLNLKRYAEARDCFDRYIKFLSKLGATPDPAGHNFRGLTLAIEGKLDQALPDFDRAIELEKSWPELWNNRAMCRARSGNAAGAIEDWKKGLELCRASGILYHPAKDSAYSFLEKLAPAYQNLAKSQREAGNEEAARASEAEAARCKSEAAMLAPPARK